MSTIVPNNFLPYWDITASKYSDLYDNATIKYYDFAPSGYFTLSKSGDIIELNLTGAKMLGKERSRLKDCKFG